MASRIICSALLILAALNSTFAQPDTKAKSSKDWVWEDEGIYRKQLQNDGMPADVIEKLVESRKDLMLQGRNALPVQQPLKLFGHNPVTQAGCSGMGVETGWGAWTATTGNFASSGIITYGAPGPPTAPRFVINSGPGVDACTPSGGGPALPVVAPNFGSASIQMGEIQKNGSLGGCSSGCVEKLTYPLTVTATDTNFTFAYAVVIEDPSHGASNQPFVSLCIYDSNGNSIGACGCFKYTAGPGLPGFFTSSCNVNSVSYYKPWTPVGINLGAWKGQTLTVEIINADCAQGGHFAQSYWDFTCGTFSQQAQYCLNSNQTVLVAPSGGPGYTYIWSTGQTTNTTSLIVNTGPPNPDTITVLITPPSGCGWSTLFVLKPTVINPAFTYTINCNTVTFSDSTTISSGSISSWNWQFPGGSPSSSTSQNPGIITYPNAGGTYTVSLSVVSLAGCAKTSVNVPMTILPPPVPNAGPDKYICVGDSTTLCGSFAGAATYLWQPGGFTTSCIKVSPTSSPTIYTLVITDANGCTGSDVVSVYINQKPVVTACCPSAICLGQTTTVLSALSSPAGVSYSWAPATGLSNPNIANPVANPAFSNTYTVTVTDINGCSNTATVPVTVNSIPYVAAIASTTICPSYPAQLNANANNGTAPYSYYWSPPNSPPINNPNIQNPITTPVNTTTYVVTVTDANGCTDDTSTVIFVQTEPTAAIAPWTPELSCDGYIVPFNLNGSSNGTSWYWDFGDGSSSTIQNPVHVYPFNGNYLVTLIVFNLPCMDSIDTTLIVSDMSGFINVLPANVFTPNGDNMNDCFHPAFTVQNIPNYTTADSLVDALSQCLFIEVYDRWGIKVFETTDTEKCWDGKTLKGQPANEGTYYYITKFGALTFKGYVTLLREK